MKINDFFKSNENRVSSLADKMLDEIECKIENAPLNQLTSALHTLKEMYSAETEGQEGLLVQIFKDFEDIK